MRKQYYLKPVQHGFDAWDVENLIKLSQKLPVISVNLDQIRELDENFWYQGPDFRKEGDYSRTIFP
jgi:vacuolar-type H+-ATPase subunit B/Vma2